MCVVLLVGIFWRNGGGEKKTPDNFPLGKFRLGHLYIHRPYLDLDFRKNVTKSRAAPNKRNLAGKAPKNAT